MHYCQFCGAQVPAGQVCSCGGGQQPQQPPPQQYGPPPPPPQYGPPQYGPPQQGGFHAPDIKLPGALGAIPGKKKAMFGMILGIVGLIFPLFSYMCICASAASSFLGTAVYDPGTYSGAAIISAIGLIVALCGLILSVVGFKELKMQGQPKGMAIAGLICGIIGLVFCISCTACYACTCQQLNSTYSGIGGLFDSFW